MVSRKPSGCNRLKRFQHEVKHRKVEDKIFRTRGRSLELFENRLSPRFN